MNKNIVALIVGCLYVAASSWIVSSQGKAHREALKQAGTSRSAPVSSKPSADSGEPNQAASEPAPRPAAPEPSRQVKSSSPPVADRPEREPGPAKAADETHSLVAARSTSRSPKTKKNNAQEQPRPSPPDPLRLAFAKATGTEVSKVAPAPIDPFWEQPPATKKWDVANLSTDLERQLGADLHAMVMNFNRRFEDANAQERVERAASPILPARSRKDIDYQFFVLDSSAVNAFSHPGGYVYITRGLLEWISEDENPALQFVLAHEIFHVDRKHAFQCLQDPGVKELPYGTLQLFYLFIFPRGYYPETMDFDADAWALLQLQRLQCTRRECMSFIRKLKGYAAAKNWGLERASALPQSGKRESLFDNHFRAHPPAFKRLEKLEALADEAGPKSK